MDIKPNNNQYTEEDNKILDAIRERISAKLETSSSVTEYAHSRWRAESYDRIIGAEFKKAGYYVAYDFVPNGYRCMIISKMPIGQPTGRLISREYA